MQARNKMTDGGAGGQPQERKDSIQSAASAAPQSARPWGRIGVLLARILLVLIFVAGAFFSLVPTGRSAARTAVLLPALLGQRAPGILTVADEPIRHTQMSVPSQGGDVYLDVYAPTTPAPPVPGVRQGLILIPGVGDNRTVDQLVNLSSSLAHKGIVVMNMTTQTLIDYDLSAVDSDAVVQTYLALAHWPGVDARRIGIIGFSAGGTLGVLAAADPRIRDTISFITIFGGYYDATTLLRDYGRRALLIDGHLHKWTPDPVPLLVLGNAIADTLPANEASLLRSADWSKAAPLDANQVAQLSPPAQAAYHLLTGDEPNAADANIAALSLQMATLLQTLSPSAVITQVRTSIYLLHDRNDVFVPFTQSRDFAAALTRLGHPHDFAEFDIFAHVEVRTGEGIGPLLRDGVTLFRIINELLLPAS
ncbi:MAG: alpha/beta hydrolase family protein [Ktedonobacterales bacterium]